MTWASSADFERCTDFLGQVHQVEYGGSLGLLAQKYSLFFCQIGPFDHDVDRDLPVDLITLVNPVDAQKEINPAYLRARLWNAAALVRAGSQDLAEWEIDEALVASPQLSLASLAFGFPLKDPRLKEAGLSTHRQARLPDR